MPIENHKKEQELLRLLWLEGGGYNRHELASVLALSTDSIGRTVSEIRTALGSNDLIQNAWPKEKEIYSYFNLQQAEGNPLVCLYSLRTLRQSELEYYLAIIRLLAKQPAGFQEILTEICQLANVDTEEQDSYKKTTVSYLKELCRAELILRESSHRGKYYLSPCPSSHLDLSEMNDLTDLVEHVAHTGKLTVYGWQLLHKLRHWLADNAVSPSALRYRQSFHGKVLDEYMVYQLQASCSRGCPIRITHYPRQQPLRYNPAKVDKRKTTNKQPRTSDLLPLKVVYDRTCARWYFFGKNINTGHFDAIRLDTIQRYTPLNKKEVTDFASQQEEFEHNLKTCHLSPGPEILTLKLCFSPVDGALKQRLTEAEPPGQIVSETESELIWSCTISDLKAIKPWLRTFGSQLEVLEPLSLRHEIADEWQRMVDMYA